MSADRPALPMELQNVRGGEEGFPVQVCMSEETGRLAIRAFNEGGFACVDIDLRDLAAWFFSDEARALIATAIEQHSDRQAMTAAP